MFIKGMKYEFRAVARIVLPLFIVFLCASMILSLGFMLDGRVFHLLESEENELLSSLAIIAVFLFSFGLIFLLIAINIAVFVMVVHRFYVSFFTDEGYLTFTLPMTVDCHLAIKIVSLFLWSLLSLVTTFIGLFIILGGAAIGYTEIFKQVLPEIPQIFESIWESLKYLYGSSQIWLRIIFSITTSVFQSFLLYFSISLGCMLFKKNRLLGAIVCVFAIDIVFSAITSFGSSIMTVFGIVSDVAAAASSVVGIVLSVVGIIASYCATKYILEHKLNLD